MNRREQIVIDHAREKGLFRARDLEGFGINRMTISNLLKNGELQKLSRGVYALPDFDADGWEDYVEITTRVSDCVYCLISALWIHELTTQIPYEIWIAMRRKANLPRIDFPKINVTRMIDSIYEHDIQEKTIAGMNIRVYSPAKTVADCFRYRSKVGLDVAMEATEEGLKKKLFTPDELYFALKGNRVLKFAQPYLERFH